MAQGGRAGVNCGLAGVEQTGLYGTHETYGGAGGARIIVFVSGLGANGAGRVSNFIWVAGQG